MIPRPLKRLENFFRRFPGIGPRQAARFSFFLFKQPKKDLESFIFALQELNSQVAACENCYMPKAVDIASCFICLDENRDKNLIYLVEKESDAFNLERPKIHAGTYFVLGQTLSPVGEDEVAKKRLKHLVRRLKSKEADTEIVLALNNTREGNFTSMYIKKMFEENDLLRSPKIKLTSLGRGLSTGSELEYADEETLRNALKNRS
jgi:recombination protein RecR